MAKKSEEKYILTPVGCLYAVLKDYADRGGFFDVEKLQGAYGEHIIHDFMEAMEKAGHIKRAEGEEEDAD